MNNKYTAEQKAILLSKAGLIKPQDSIILVGAPFEMPPTPSDSPLVQELFQVLFGGKAQNLKKAFSHLYKTLTGPGKQAFLKKEREALQGLIKTFYPKLKKLQSKEEHFWGAALLGQFLAYYTFFGPENGEIFTVPIDLDGEGTWQLFDYTVEKIPLTPSWMGSQAFAFGLTSSEKEAPPLLLFKGTSYPTDEGFYLQLLSDFNPFASVGSYLFCLGKKNVETWLKKSSPAKVYGMSLGGSLTEHAVLHFPSLIKSAFIYNSPGLLPWEVTKISHPDVHIFRNENDLSSLSGLSYGKGWNVYEVLVNNPPSFLAAHVQCYFGRKESIILKVDGTKRSWRQILVASLHLLFSIPLFFIGSTVYAIAQVFKRGK